MEDLNKMWSRDWSSFDWKPVFEKLQAAQGEDRDLSKLGLSKAEVEEYCKWLTIHKPEVFAQLQKQMKDLEMEDLNLQF
jgi:hypothetical protein